MNTTVTVPLPLNITDDNLQLYAAYTKYEWHAPKIKFLKNVFVAFSGFCINANGLIKESHHAYPFQYNYYLNEAEQYYHDVKDHPDHLITLDDDIYLVIHHPWFNYYHWICESIFRLWMVRHRLNKIVLVLPEHYKHADFITGSLAPFKLKHIYFIPNGHSLFVRNLCLPQIKPLCDSYSKIYLSQVANFYKRYTSYECPKTVPAIERLYVSRALANRRKIINEAEVVEVMQKHGFTIFNPEDFTFLQQVAIFAKVKYLIGAHGSGLTNMLFMNKNTSVLELTKSRTNDLNHPSFLFWYMAETLHIKYYHQICETHGREDYFEGNYIVNINLLEENLIKMLQS